MIEPSSLSQGLNLHRGPSNFLTASKDGEIRNLQITVKRTAESIYPSVKDHIFEAVKKMMGVFVTVKLSAVHYKLQEESRPP